MTYAVSRPVKSRARIRAFNDETAHQALTLAGWGKDREAFGFNKGQFSIIDLVLAALRFTGPAEATIATWTAADADLRRTAETLKCGQFKSVRWIVDRSFEARQPAFCATMRELFGDDTIRTLANHAKFILLKSDDWSVIIQTSMNLNFNKRIENFWIADDAELFSEFSALVDDVFANQKAGESFGEAGRKAQAQTARLGRRKSADPFASVVSAATITALMPDT